MALDWNFFFNKKIMFAFILKINGEKMPTISMFYGIIIFMYFMDNNEHNLSHIHAKYQEFEAVFE